MEKLRGVGCIVGEYIGDVQGDHDSATVNSPAVEDGPVDADPGVDHQESEGDDDEEGDESGREDSYFLLVFFDSETTWFSIYSDHITDIAAKMVASPVPLSQPTLLERLGIFLQLVKNKQ